MKKNVARTMGSQISPSLLAVMMCSSLSHLTGVQNVGEYSEEMPHGSIAVLHCEPGSLFENGLSVWQAQCAMVDPWTSEWSPAPTSCRGKRTA